MFEYSASQVPRFEQLLALFDHMGALVSASQVPRFEQLLAGARRTCSP